MNPFHSYGQALTLPSQEKSIRQGRRRQPTNGTPKAKV